LSGFPRDTALEFEEISFVVADGTICMSNIPEEQRLKFMIAYVNTFGAIDALYAEPFMFITSDKDSLPEDERPLHCCWNDSYLAKT
jgi:hypothetical protein